MTDFHPRGDEPPPESGTTSMGHFDRFPQPKLNGRCPFS